MQVATINGISLHFRDEGPRNGPALVFVNSLGTDFRIWDDVVSAFPERRVIRYDKRGHGLSDAPAAPYSIDEHTADLSVLLDRLGVKRAALVGLSVGGMIVTRIAAAQPERVSALVLCDTAHKIGTEELWNQRIAAVEQGGIAAVSEIVLQRWFSPRFRTAETARFQVCRNMLERMPVAGYAGTCAALRDADNTDLVRQLAMPVLLLVGSNDGSTPPELVRSTHELVPGSEFVIIEGPGHIPCVEAPEETAHLIRGFLARAGD
jgi:3-oxoadipate enol-lactonase